jgi:predicted Zn-dependent protease
MNISPNKIQIRSIKSSKTLRNIFNGFGVPEKKLEELAIMNGMDLMQSGSAGTKLKIVS